MNSSSKIEVKPASSRGLGIFARVDYLINNPGGDSWQCRCGSSRCRGKTGTSYFDLPLHFQKEYYPLLAEWFKAKFPKEIAELEKL